MQFEEGAVLEGKITRITKFGAFVELSEGKTGMVHISEIAPIFVKEIRDFVTEGQQVKVKILSIDENGKISLSMKQALEKNSFEQQGKRNNYNKRTEARTSSSSYEKNNTPKSFEDMISKFKKESDEKMLDLKKVTESKRGGSSKRSGYSK